MAPTRWFVELLHNVRKPDLWGVSALVTPKKRKRFVIYYGDNLLRQGVTAQDGKKLFNVPRQDFGEDPQWEKLRIEEVRPAERPQPAPVQQQAEALVPEAIPEGVLNDGAQAPAVEEPQVAPAPEVVPAATAQPAPARVREEPRRRRERREPPQRQDHVQRQPQQPEWTDLNVEILNTTSQGWQGTMVVAQVTGNNGDGTRKGVKGKAVVFSDEGIAVVTKKTNADGLVKYLARRVGIREVHVVLAGISPINEDHTTVY